MSNKEIKQMYSYNNTTSYPLEILKASVTPIASIFGSGFLVIVPILNGTLGYNAWVGMLLICLLAYAVGSTIRSNILIVEPLIIKKTLSKGLSRVEKSSDLILSLAYCISISLYLHVMVSFILASINVQSLIVEQLIVCLLIIIIGAIGWFHGLSKLSILENISLLVTVLMILLVIISFIANDYQFIYKVNSIHFSLPNHISSWGILAVLGGSLIVVQGFETTRYLGREYNSQVRIKACKFSQLFTTIIYMVLIFSLTPWLYNLNGISGANGLFFLIRNTLPFLAIPLVCVAVLSQFSAALADTIAGAEDIIDNSKKKIDRKHAYLRVCVIAILFSFTKTYTVLVLSSKAFALYYLFQGYLAFRLNRRVFKKVLYLLIQIILIWIVVFAKPIG